MSLNYMIIGADFVPTSSNEKLFAEGNITELFGNDLLHIMENAVWRIFNLEAPIVQSLKPSIKCGPNMKISPATLPGILKIKPTAFSIANNHIMDYGKQGLKETIDILEKNGIQYFGAGFTRKNAIEVKIFKYAEKKIGIFSCAEHEFSVCNDYCESGGNPYDPLETFDYIEEFKKKCDYLIVLFHGGAELYRYPTPEQQKICQKMVRSGANLVLCQHSHCIGALEEYKTGKILYGQGNFIFDKNIEAHQTSLLVQLFLDDFKIDFIPLIRKENKVRLAYRETASNILEGLHNRSEEIKSDVFIKNHYEDFVSENTRSYIYKIKGKYFLYIIERLTQKNILKILIRKKELLFLLAVIRCETHRERLIKYLEKIIFSQQEN